MNCEKYQQWMTDFLAGELAVEQQAELHEHLAGCDDCNREFAELEKLWNLTESSLNRESIPAARLSPERRGQILQAASNPSRRGVFGGRLLWFELAAAAVIVIFFGSALLIELNQDMPQAANAAISKQDVSVPVKVEKELATLQAKKLYKGAANVRSKSFIAKSLEEHKKQQLPAPKFKDSSATRVAGKPVARSKSFIAKSLEAKQIVRKKQLPAPAFKDNCREPVKKERPAMLAESKTVADTAEGDALFKAAPAAPPSKMKKALGKQRFQRLEEQNMRNIEQAIKRKVAYQSLKPHSVYIAREAEASGYDRKDSFGAAPTMTTNYAGRKELRIPEKPVVIPYDRYRFSFATVKQVKQLLRDNKLPIPARIELDASRYALKVMDTPATIAKLKKFFKPAIAQ